jgi:hypothetical protein
MPTPSVLYNFTDTFFFLHGVCILFTSSSQHCRCPEVISLWVRTPAGRSALNLHNHILVLETLSLYETLCDILNTFSLYSLPPLFLRVENPFPVPLIPTATCSYLRACVSPSCQPFTPCVNSLDSG